MDDELLTMVGELLTMVEELLTMMRSSQWLISSL